MNFYSSWYHQKTYGFLMISGGQQLTHPFRFAQYQKRTLKKIAQYQKIASDIQILNSNIFNDTSIEKHSFAGTLSKSCFEIFIIVRKITPAIESFFNAQAQILQTSNQNNKQTNKHKNRKDHLGPNLGHNFFWRLQLYQMLSQASAMCNVK